MVELKNEVEEGGIDPIMQAERSYTSILYSPGVGFFLFYHTGFPLMGRP